MSNKHQNIRTIAELLSEGKILSVIDQGQQHLLCSANEKYFSDKIQAVKAQLSGSTSVCSLFKEDSYQEFLQEEHPTSGQTYTYTVRPEWIGQIPASINDGCCEARLINQSEPLLFDILSQYEDIIGFPVLLYTSIEPISEDCQQAIDNTHLDVLVVDEQLFVKSTDNRLSGPSIGSGGIYYPNGK